VCRRLLPRVYQKLPSSLSVTKLPPPGLGTVYVFPFLDTLQTRTTPSKQMLRPFWRVYPITCPCARKHLLSHAQGRAAAGPNGVVAQHDPSGGALTCRDCGCSHPWQHSHAA
jgi:hypothetical protein